MAPSRAALAPAGKPVFASPHSDPIALSPNLPEVYVANTPADTLDVLDEHTGAVVARVVVGVDPVAVAVRPDGKEVWVSNHLSDSVSVVDVDPASAMRYRVVATVTAWDETGWVTDFDEPVGLAFASNDKAYVSLSSRNRIAVVDVATRVVTKQVQVLAQEPRAIAVRGDRLYVLPFESGNQTELSGCLDPDLPSAPPGCTFSLADLVSNPFDAILTRNLTADIHRNARIPDRDLFVFDTADESPLFEVPTLGTLLYGLAVDSAGRVFVAMTEARNDANGAAGTLGHGLAEMDNRAFLNQVARVDCSIDCGPVAVFDLEPALPVQPSPSDALATPFGIRISDDDTTVVAVAAASSRLFTLDAASGAVLGRTDVGAIPRGLALASAPDGSPETAWVYNALENSVSRIDVSDPSAPNATALVALDDPTHAAMKAGRIAFNDATASTNGTFSCASCHPDGNTDQILWNLGALCTGPGCDQFQPRSTMPIRGLRDTLPLHWDGVPGDPFGGINGLILGFGGGVPPNCTDDHSCFRNLIDGALATTMCDQSDCPSDVNEFGLAGAYDEARRDALAVFLSGVPYPPARSRRLDDRLSVLATEGFRHFLGGASDEHTGCSRAGGVCHAFPFWAGTNSPGTGFDAPTFRGLTDRHLILPSGRENIWDSFALASVTDVDWDPHDGPDELFTWGVIFGTDAEPRPNRVRSGAGPFGFWQLFEEGGTGFAASYGKQVTLDAATMTDTSTVAILDRLERADRDGVVNLHADGATLAGGDPLALAYEGGVYVSRQGPAVEWTSEELRTAAAAGDALVTVTARAGTSSDVEHPQPALWLAADPESTSDEALIPELVQSLIVALFGRHVAPDPVVLVDGQAVDATVVCELGGVLPSCDGERLLVALFGMPSPGGLRTLQLANPGGLVSNEVPLSVAGATGSCPRDPRADCVTAAGRSQLKFRDGDAERLRDPADSRDKAQAKIRHAGPVGAAELGDPAQDATVSFCVYDAGALAFGVDIDAGDGGWNCEGAAGARSRCKYKNPDGSAFGVAAAVVKAGSARRAGAKVKIRRGTFAAPGLPLSVAGPVVVQASTSAGLCQQALFVPPYSKNDRDSGRFQARR